MRFLRWLVVAGVFGGCVLNTNRTRDLKDGEIKTDAGRAVRRADGSVAKGAVIQIAGSDRAVAVDDAGAFRIGNLTPGTWVLNVGVDDEGDGVVDERAVVPVEIKFVPVPKNLTDGCTGAPVSAVTSVLLGDIALAKTAHVAGTVSGVPAGNFARVVVWRDADVGGAAHQGPIEGAGGVGVTGDFDVGGVGAGNVHVAVFTYDPVADPKFQKPVTFGTADATAGDENVVVDASHSARLDADATKLKKVAVQIDAQWDTPNTPNVTLSLTTFLAPSSAAEIADPSSDGAALDEQTKAFVVDAPVGVVDLAFQSDTDGAAGGTLRGAVIVPDASGQGLLDGALLGPVELPVFADACAPAATGADDAVHDCDHDSVEGLLKPSDDPADPLIADYRACNADCEDAFGVDGAGAVCNNNTDCDDDGDGQPDVTEPPACIGPGLGTDLDGDDLCEPAADPFPLCADNDPATCPQAFTPPPTRYP